MCSSNRRFPMALPDISELASLFADKTRAAMCGALMSGTAWTAGELATFTGVSKSTATEQINKLLKGGIIKEQRQGRHRYLMIASPEVAHLIEVLAQASGQRLCSPQSLTANRDNDAFQKGRTCYQHLAGEMGVRLLEQLRQQAYITPDFQLTKRGIQLLSDWHIKTPTKWVGSPCMDTTQRVFHLGGSLGRVLCQYFLEQRWLMREKETRCVYLTDEGHQQLLWHQINLKAPL